MNIMTPINMKSRLFSTFMVIILSVMQVAFAANLNIFASGLSATQTNDTITILYRLNTQATSLDVLLYTSDINAPVATIPVTNFSYLTSGAHVVAMTLPTDLNGTFKWGIRATSSATSFTEATTDNDRYRYYFPQDVAVDNNFESPYFGRIYVSESTVGRQDGGSNVTKNQTRGLYILTFPKKG